MLERFTREARDVVTDAVGLAREQELAKTDQLHVLVALVGTAEVSDLLDALGVRADDVRAKAEQVRRRGGLSESDAAALDELGIDVDRIVSRVEKVHGENALAGRRQRKSLASGHVPFSAEAKKVLEETLKAAISLGDRSMGTGHLLLGVLTARGPATDVLVDLGVDVLAVRRSLVRRQAS
jgi:ATP-dependent Clp protease ATP-binding subunit ClpA